MKNFNTIDDIKERAIRLSSNPSKLILLSIEYGLYMEISLKRQLTVVSGNSGEGKTYLMNQLQSLLVNNGKIDTRSNIFDNLNNLQVFLSPSEISSDKDKSIIYFVDHGDILNKEEAAIINRLLRNKRTVILFARMPDLIETTMPSFFTTLEVKQVDGIDCFFINRKD